MGAWLPTSSSESSTDDDEWSCATVDCAQKRSLRDRSWESIGLGERFVGCKAEKVALQCARQMDSSGWVRFEFCFHKLLTAVFGDQPFYRIKCQEPAFCHNRD